MANQIYTGTDGVINTFIGDASVLSNSTGGNDTATGGADGAINTLFGDAQGMTLSTGGNDILTGGAGPDTTNTLYGDALFLFSSTGGNDTLTGGAGAYNTLYGDAGGMATERGSTILSTGGNDTLTGGADGATNNLYGDALQPNSRGGNDRLVSGAHATDNMWGDGPSPVSITGGHDTFAFRSDNGNDFIYDFRHNDGDIIELGGLYRIPIPTSATTHLPKQAVSHVLQSFSDLNIETDGISSVIHLDAFNSITVFGVANLTASDFHFVL